MQYLNDNVKDKVDFLPADKHGSLLQIDTKILMGMVKFTMPLLFLKNKVGDEVDFLQVDKHQSFPQVNFSTLSIKVSYKVMLSFDIIIIRW